jgi:serine/threonine protein kinase
MVEHDSEEIRLRKLMKKKLNITNIPDLMLEDSEGNMHYFNEYYDYLESLGCGGFGFVVSAVHKASGEKIALKLIETSISDSVVRLFM